MIGWKKYNGALIPLIPPHIKTKVDLNYIRRKIISEHAFFARWVSEFDRKKESSFWYVINDKAQEMKDYSVNTRSKIRRGFKELEVRKISRKDILKYGYSVYSAAFKRYKTINKPMNKSEFISYITNLDDLWEFWGVFYKTNDKLVGYSENKVVDNQCYYSTIKFHTDYLKKYPSYVLYYTMNRYYLKEKKLAMRIGQMPQS